MVRWRIKTIMPRHGFARASHPDDFERTRVCTARLGRPVAIIDPIRVSMSDAVVVTGALTRSKRSHPWPNGATACSEVRQLFADADLLEQCRHIEVLADGFGLSILDVDYLNRAKLDRSARRRDFASGCL